MFRGQVNKELFEEIKAGREGSPSVPKK